MKLKNNFSIDIERLLQDHNINIAPTYNKHSRPGWININCPFCNSSHNRFHLGYNINRNYFFCWRCGWHDTYSTLTTILKINKRELTALLINYKKINISQPKKIINPPETIKMPDDCGSLNSNHRKYLANRNFDADYLIKQWGILGTNNWGNYKYRIIAPIYFEHEIVSYQGRDYTGKQIPYLACAKENEIIPHKKILYGFDQATWDNCIIVEGLFDVWRLGPGALCTFGAKYTPSQLLLIAKNFKNVFLLFDNDPAGWEATDKMKFELENMNVNTETITLKNGDAGNLEPKTAKEIMHLVKNAK